MALQGSSPYYLHRGGIGGPGGGSGPSHNVHGGGGGGHNIHGGGGGGSPAAQSGLMHTTPTFKNLPNPSISMQGMSGGAVSGPSYRVENPSPDFTHSRSMAMVSHSGEQVKKKRGRPRKYGPDGANMSLGLSPVPASKPSSSPLSPGDKGKRGRPPGSGWKQKLAPLGKITLFNL